jgi:hypothetical protein
MELPNPPWYRRWSFILAGVIGLAAITALVGWAGLQNVPPETTSPTVVPTTTTTTTPPTSTRPPTTTTTTRGPGVLWTETGSDTSKSTGFRAPSRWRIEWSFDCSNFRGLGGGNFKITGDGAFERVEIQRYAVEARGRREFSTGGFGHLLIDSVCRRWTVTARDD